MSTTTTSDMMPSTTSTSKPFALPVTTPESSGVRWFPQRSLETPLHWRKPRTVGIPTDLFHEDVPDEFIDRVFAIMALTPQHTYQCLTKRPDRMQQYFAAPNRGELICYAMDAVLNYPGPLHGPSDWPLPNVWLGVTVENQHWADVRIPILLDTPAAVRFISAEPLLSPLSIEEYVMGYDGSNEYETGVSSLYRLRDPGVHWVIIGGESGPKHRPFAPEWARSIVQQCREAGVAAFVKQMSGFRPGARLENLPEDLRIREFPDVN